MKQHERGWAALDMGLSLLALIAVIVFAGSKYQQYIQEKNWQVEAARTDSFAAASRHYVGQNYVTLLSTVTTTSPAVISTAMLKNTGFLPAGFSDTNGMGQQLQAYITRNPQNTNLLQGAVVATGGTAYPLKALIMMAKNIKTGFGGYTSDGQTMIGAQRAWRIPLNEYGATGGNGHLAVMLSTTDLSTAQEDSDRLYRFQVNGRPELNTMHTAIDMGTNNINNAGDIDAVTGKFSGDVQGKNGSFSEDVTADGKITAKGNLQTGGVLQLDQVNVKGVACYPNGLVSRDATGGILSCQSGAWEASGSKDTKVVFGGGACTGGSATAICPASTKVTGCGSTLTSYNKNGNSPDTVAPLGDSTGCAMWVGGWSQACFQVWAVCR